MKMSHIKEIQKQIAELNKNIQQNQGDVNQLQEKLNQLLIAEFEEELREEGNNSQQLLKG
jgi:hypothetical protein